MKDKVNITYAVEGVSAVLTAIQNNPVYQTIQFILTVIGLIVSIGYTTYKWYKSAKADGKVTPEELKQLVNQTTDDVEKLQEEIQKGVNKDEKVDK